MTDAALHLDPARLDRAFDIAARHVASGITSYAGLAVATSGGPVRIEGYHRNGRQGTAQRAPIASITKPITAVAVLHEPLSTYLPEFQPLPTLDGEPDEPMTAWHLLTHTSGLPEAGVWLDGVPRPHHEILARMWHTRPDFQPGTAFRYTSDTFYLLAEVIARVSGRPFPAYLDECVFGPLGMRATGFDPDAPAPGVTIDGRIGPPGTPEPAMRELMRATTNPGGGLWSTPQDILRFGQAVLGRGTLGGVTVLGAPFIELMLRRHTAHLRELGTGRRPNYGLAWGFPGLGRGTPSSAGAFAHAGGTGSILHVDPAWDLVIVHLRNRWDATMTATDEIIQAVYGALRPG